MGIHSSLRLAGITFDNALMNGAYVGSKTLADVEILAKSKCGAIVVGSISVKPRKPNPGLTYWSHKERFYALNSYGLPNGGIPYFKKNLPLMVKIAHAQNKPLIANLVGFSKNEFVELIGLAQDSNADMAELNFGCPNIWENGKQKRIISYHADIVIATLDIIRKQKLRIKLSVKISPLPPDILRDVAEAITKSGIVDVVTATNSFPNASVSTGTRVAGEEALAGLTGRALKPISLGVVKQLKVLLPKKISIIGCGGTSSANDVSDYLLAGAKAVQIATALVDEGPSIFEKILFQSSKSKLLNF